MAGAEGSHPRTTPKSSTPTSSHVYQKLHSILLEDFYQFCQLPCAMPHCKQRRHATLGLIKRSRRVRERLESEGRPSFGMLGLGYSFGPCQLGGAEGAKKVSLLPSLHKLTSHRLRSIMFGCTKTVHKTLTGLSWS